MGGGGLGGGTDRIRKAVGSPWDPGEAKGKARFIWTIGSVRVQRGGETEVEICRLGGSFNFSTNTITD